MKAVVLAGGQEFGQCPLSRQAPRALWPLGDKSIIEHLLRELRRFGIGEMAVSANGRTPAISAALSRHPASDIAIHYSEDHLPRGAAGCIKDCEEWLGNDTFLVVNAASLFVNVDFAHLIEQHRSSGAAITIAAVSEGSCDGDEGDAFSMKPAGLYVCEPGVLQYIKTRGYQDIKEQLIPRLVQAGLKVQATAIRGRILPIRNEESYLNAMVDVLEDEDERQALTGHLPAKAPGLWIDPTAIIHPTARIVGPAFIGARARIEADAVVIGPALIGEDCTVETDAIVHESILWNSATVGAGAMVEQTVMASKSRVSPGVEARGSIVVETALSGSERRSLSGSMDFAPIAGTTGRGFWRRLWNCFRPAARQAV
jgi:NDP-sugar pyrophosphorylase family protein